MKPTLEEVKEYFKDAKLVECLFNKVITEINSEIQYYSEDNEFWSNDDDLELWNCKQGYAEIVETKSTTPERYKTKIDPIVTSVMTQLLTRSQLGINKYGTTLEDNNTDDFLQHLKEELMDAVLYIEKLQTQRDGSKQ